MRRSLCPEGIVHQMQGIFEGDILVVVSVCSKKHPSRPKTKTPISNDKQEMKTKIWLGNKSLKIFKRNRRSVRHGTFSLFVCEAVAFAGIELV